MHHIAILALHDVVPFDLSTPCEVFSRVRTADEQAAYQVRVCGEATDIRAGMFDLRVHCGLSQLRGADTVIVPGLSDPSRVISQDVLMALRQAAAEGARLASICTGAFVLAAAGLLDGRRATTHWMVTSELARRYPAVIVDPNVLFVDNGDILTSAGAAAGLDLCLHMVRCDHGAAVAADIARKSVMPLAREGGQAQYIVHESPCSASSLQPLLQWLEKHLKRQLSLEEIANKAATSSRTLNRRFIGQVGTTPLQWLLNARVRRAQHLLETTQLTIEQVATEAGFSSATTLRERFSRKVGNTPQAYRRAFGANAQRR